MTLNKKFTGHTVLVKSFQRNQTVVIADGICFHYDHKIPSKYVANASAISEIQESNCAK